MTSADLEAVLRGNPWLAALLDRFDSIALPDCWIVAGALAQTVWNHRFGLPPTTGIADIDIVQPPTKAKPRLKGAGIHKVVAQVWLCIITMQYKNCNAMASSW